MHCHIMYVVVAIGNFVLGVYENIRRPRERNAKYNQPLPLNHNAFSLYDSLTGEED